MHAPTLDKVPIPLLIRLDGNATWRGVPLLLQGQGAAELPHVCYAAAWRVARVVPILPGERAVALREVGLAFGSFHSVLPPRIEPR